MLPTPVTRWADLGVFIGALFPTFPCHRDTVDGDGRSWPGSGKLSLANAYLLQTDAFEPKGRGSHPAELIRLSAVGKDGIDITSINNSTRWSGPASCHLPQIPQ